MFNGIYWYLDCFVVGYGLKGYKDVYGIKDIDGFKLIGFGYYVVVIYKF